MNNQGLEAEKKSSRKEYSQKENVYSGNISDELNPYIYPPFLNPLSSEIFKSYQKMPEFMERRNNFQDSRSRNLAKNLYSLNNLRNSYEHFFEEKYLDPLEQDFIFQKRRMEGGSWGETERKEYEEGMNEHLEIQGIRMEILKTKKEELDLIIRRLKIDIELDLDRLREFQLSKARFRDRINNIEKDMWHKSDWFRETELMSGLRVSDIYQNILPQNGHIFQRTDQMLGKRNDYEFSQRG